MLNDSIRIDEEILQSTKKSRISKVIRTEQILKNRQNIAKDATKDICKRIKKKGQGLSVFFNQKLSLAYLLDDQFISVFSFNEEPSQRIYQKIIIRLPGKLLKNPPIFYRTSEQLILILFTRTSVFIQNLFDKKINVTNDQKVTDKTEELVSYTLMKQTQKFCYIKILDSNFVLKIVQISNRGSITVNKCKNQFKKKKKTILQGLKNLLMSSNNKDQDYYKRYAKLFFAKHNKMKLTGVLQHKYLQIFFEGSNNYFFVYEEVDLVNFIEQHEKEYLSKNKFDLQKTELCDIILVHYDKIKPLFACVYTLRCRNKINYQDYTCCKLTLFEYKPSQIQLFQSYILSESSRDHTYITDYILLTQDNYNNNNYPVITNNKSNTKIFVILKYYTLHNSINESNLFEVDLEKNLILHKLVEDDIYGGGVMLGASYQEIQNFFVINKKSVMFFEDCNGLKLKNLQDRQSLPFIDEEMSRIIFPENLQTSIVLQGKINENEKQDIDYDPKSEIKLFQMIKQGFSMFLNKEFENSEKNKIIHLIKTKSDQKNYSIVVEKIIANMFEKQSFRMSTATRIEREDLNEVIYKQKYDENYTDAISTDLMFKLKELNKFHEFLQKLDLNENYKHCYELLQTCIFLCQNIIIFRDQQVKNYKNQKIQNFINKCVKKIFNQNYNKNPDYLYTNLFTFNNIYNKINEYLDKNFQEHKNDTTILKFVNQIYIAILQNIDKKLKSSDINQQLKIRPNKNNNIFKYCVNFLELILKLNISNRLQLDNELQKLNSLLIQILFKLYQLNKIQQYQVQKYIDILFKYYICDKNCYDYFQIFNNQKQDENLIKLLYNYNLPFDSINIKNENQTEEEFKKVLKQIILKGIEILKDQQSSQEDIIKVKNVFKSIEIYSINIIDILENINQPYLHSLFAQNFKNEDYIKFFPKCSTNRKLNNLIQVIDQNSQRNSSAQVSKLDYQIQRYQLLRNDQEFNLEILLQNIQKKITILTLSQTIQIIGELAKKYQNQIQEQQKVQETFIKILHQKITKVKNSKAIAKRLILNLKKIRKISNILPESQQLQKFIETINHLTIPNQINYLDIQSQICQKISFLIIQFFLINTNNILINEISKIFNENEE